MSLVLKGLLCPEPQCSQPSSYNNQIFIISDSYGFSDKPFIINSFLPQRNLIINGIFAHGFRVSQFIVYFGIALKSISGIKWGKLVKWWASDKDAIQTHSKQFKQGTRIFDIFERIPKASVRKYRIFFPIKIRVASIGAFHCHTHII